MRKQILILILAGMFCLTACNQTANDQPKDTPTQEEQDDIDDSDDEGEENQVTDLDDSDSEDENTNEQDIQTPSESTSIIIYSSNDDATAFVSEKVQISTLSPEEVLNALVGKGIISSDIEVRSFNTITIDGKPSIEIDFNSAFVSYIMSMGSTGEYYTIGSICNTFLDAYDCEQIKITVEEATLESGHKDYPGYMTTFS